MRTTSADARLAHSPHNPTVSLPRTHAHSLTLTVSLPQYLPLRLPQTPPTKTHRSAHTPRVVQSSSSSLGSAPAETGSLRIEFSKGMAMEASAVDLTAGVERSWAVQVVDGSTARMTRCQVRCSPDTGIAVARGSALEMADCEVSESGECGVLVDHSALSMRGDCVLERNGVYGVAVVGAASAATLEGVAFRVHKQAGVLAWASVVHCTRCTISDVLNGVSACEAGCADVVSCRISGVRVGLISDANGHVRVRDAVVENARAVVVCLGGGSAALASSRFRRCLVHPSASGTVQVGSDCEVEEPLSADDLGGGGGFRITA